MRFVRGRSVVLACLLATIANGVSPSLFALPTGVAQSEDQMSNQATFGATHLYFPIKQGPPGSDAGCLIDPNGREICPP